MGKIPIPFENKFKNKGAKKMDITEQNQVTLFLFNNIKLKKYKYLWNTRHIQTSVRRNKNYIRMWYKWKKIYKNRNESKNNLIGLMRVGDVDYISLSDLAKYENPKDPSGIIRNWMSNKDSFAFYSLCEELHNDNFNSMESHRIKINEVGYNRFTMTPNH